MKKIFLIAVLLVVAFVVYWFKFRADDNTEGPKQVALKVGKHSQAFNSSIDSFVYAYLEIKNAFVEADSLKAKQAGNGFIAFLSKVNIDELKKDTTSIFETASGFLNDVKASAESMGKGQTITDMRQDFKSISDNMYPFLRAIHYEGKKLYWQICPMAFGEDKPANWISNTEEIVNPYMGKYHPEYKSSMLHCGEVQDTIKAQ